jgi:hypothetical protein
MIRPGTLIENAYVVADLEAAVDFWTHAGNAGPFFLGEYDLPAAGCTHRGQVISLRNRGATRCPGRRLP